MQSLSKTRMELTRYFTQDNTYSSLWKDINTENQLTKEMISSILENTPWEQVLGSTDSIALREDIVLPLLVIQQYALMELERSTTDKDAYENLVIRTLYGIINAARNSA